MYVGSQTCLDVSPTFCIYYTNEAPTPTSLDSRSGEKYIGYIKIAEGSEDNVLGQVGLEMFLQVASFYIH